MPSRPSKKKAPSSVSKRSASKRVLGIPGEKTKRANGLRRVSARTKNKTLSAAPAAVASPPFVPAPESRQHEDRNEYLAPSVEGLIIILRGKKVILDADLARIYGVQTKRLNEQVRRNKDRFPQDFAFQLTTQEMAYVKSEFSGSSFGPLRSQFATLKNGRGMHRKYLPWAFTEHGAIMPTFHKSYKVVGIVPISLAA
jgi:hypothetical protein